MKDFTREELELSGSALRDVPDDAIDFCLDQLFEDQTKSFQDDVCPGLSFEELIGALLKARERLRFLEMFDRLSE